MRKFISTLSIVALFGGYAFYTFTSPMPGTQPETPASSTPTDGPGAIGQRRPEYALPDLQGTLHRPGEWDGKVVLVNFWATWCPPCRKEIPGFIRLREEYAGQGFDIVGIAIDNPTAIAEFAKEIDFNYTLLHGESNAAQLSRAFGDTMGGLPFSALLDRQGIIRFLKAGELTEDVLEKQIKLLL